MDRGPMSLPTNNARVDCGPSANQARRTTARIAQEGAKGKVSGAGAQVPARSSDDALLDQCDGFGDRGVDRHVAGVEHRIG